MEDTLSNKDAALAIGSLLAEHKGLDVAVLDLSALRTWTDYFVLATVTSHTHQQGLQRHIKEFAVQRNLEILRRQRKAAAEDEWNLIDMGGIVVHLMTERARSFYDLERLWSEAKVLWRGGA